MNPADAWQHPPHTFPPAFQWAVVKLMVSDPTFFMQVRPHLPLEFVARDEHGGEYLARALGLIYAHADRQEYRNQPPAYMVFETLVEDALRGMDAAQAPVWRDGLKQTASWLYARGWGAGEAEFVREQVFRWIRDRASRSLTVEIKKAIDAGQDIEQMRVVERAKEIAMIGLSTADQGIAMFEDMDATMRWLLMAETRYVLGTGDEHFDRAMGGGFGRKELTTFIATPGGGKSTLMCAKTADLLKQGRRGIYVTLEQSELLINQKISSSIFGLTRANWWSVETSRQWVQYLHQIGARLRVREFPADRATVTDIEAYLLTTAQQWGAMPDFLVIDYADLCRPRQRHENLRHQLSEIYTHIRSIGQTYNLAVITASQANRGAVDQEYIGIQHLAEAFDKAAVSDVMIGIGIPAKHESDERGGPTEATLYWAKNRNEIQTSLAADIHYDISRVVPRPERKGTSDAPMESKLGGILGNFR